MKTSFQASLLRFARRKTLVFLKGAVIFMLDIGLILKVAGVGILVSAAAQILQKSGRDEQSMLVVIAGIIVVLIMLVGEIEKLFELVISVFGF